MSSRALRRLRQERDGGTDVLLLAGLEEEDVDGDEVSSSSDHNREEEDDAGGYERKQHAFRAMMMDDSSSSSSSSSSSDDDDDGSTSSVAAVEESDGDGSEDGSRGDEDTGPGPPARGGGEEGSATRTAAAKKGPRSGRGRGRGGRENGDDVEEEEDLDALLDEFKSKTTTSGDAASPHPRGDDVTETATASSVLLGGIDPRTLDLDFVMRTMLGRGGGGNAAAAAAAAGAEQPPNPQQQQRGRGGGGGGGGRRMPTVTKKFLFGKPRANWTKPPTFLGGGIGMAEQTFDGVGGGMDDSSSSSSDGGDYVPFPYDEGGSNANDVSWQTFTHSDTYAATLNQYDTAVRPSGDVNQLAIFVANNPYCAEAVLQLASVLCHTGDMERGTEFVRRAVYVYESAMTGGFVGAMKSGFVVAGGGEKKRGNVASYHVDSEGEVNRGFYLAMWRLIQISSMMGCVESSLSVSRFLLSLDPLRDPMGILLTLDYFALAAVNVDNARFVTGLVRSRLVRIHHQDGDGVHHTCDLLDMPNWAFHYALALKRIEDDGLSDEGIEDVDSDNGVPSRDDADGDFSPLLPRTADDALRSALRRFPSVLPLLLEKNGVDVRSRSFQTDWPPVLDHFGAMEGSARSADNSRAVDHIVKIFVQRSHKLWAADDVLRWLYDCSSAVMASDAAEVEQPAPIPPEDGDENATDVARSTKPDPYPGALSRYLRAVAADYEDSFPTLPADANPLDEALVGPALAMDPNRRRVRMPQQQHGWDPRAAGQAEIGLQRMILEQIGVENALNHGVEE